jgi:hypothetical protein
MAFKILQNQLVLMNVSCDVICGLSSASVGDDVWS